MNWRPVYLILYLTLWGGILFSLADCSADALDEQFMGLTRASAIVEQNVKGQILHGEMDTEQDILCYRFDIAKTGVLFRVWVDAQSGRIVKSRKPWLTNLWDDIFGLEKMNLGSKTLPVSIILKKLESDTGGRAELVKVKSTDGPITYEVELATSAGPATVVLDALTGRRTPREAN